MNDGADLIEAWEVHHRVNLRLLELVGEDHLSDSYAKRVRDIGKVFSHIHNTRIMWLEALDAKPEDVRKVDKGAVPKLDAIRSALEGSSSAMVDVIRKAVAKGKVPGFKRSPTTFVAYLIAHEAHHRGQVIAALRTNGHALDQEEIYGLWEWDRI